MRIILQHKVSHDWKNLDNFHQSKIFYALFPNSGLLACFNVVESNMISRRAEVARLLKDDESIMTISFPALGTPDFTSPSYEPRPDDDKSCGCSLFFPDEAIYAGHPRYGMLFCNVFGNVMMYGIISNYENFQFPCYFRC